MNFVNVLTRGLAAWTMVSFGIAATAGCPSPEEGTEDGGTQTSGKDGSMAADGSVRPGGDGGATTRDASGPSNVESCDGWDNDSDGIIDNVDVDSDGICDCIRIATLGFKGKWGSGDVFNNWLNGKSLQGADELGSQVLTDALLSAYHVIVVQDARSGSADAGVGNGIGRTYSTSEVQALARWVQNGGGLMTLMGYSENVEISNVNLLLAPFGLSYGSEQILQKSGSSTVPVTHWATHPISEGISRIGVDNGYPVNGGTVIAWEPNQGAWDVASVALSGSGHVFAWCDEWITYDSEWSSHPDYQVQRFWLNSIKWLTRMDFCQVEIPDWG